jgi:hypothetical protein
MDLEIAHQVVWTTRSRAPPKLIGRSASSLKKRGWASCRISIPRPFPTSRAGSCLVGRRAMLRHVDQTACNRSAHPPVHHSRWTRRVQPIRASACPSFQVDEARATDLRIALSI